MSTQLLKPFLDRAGVVVLDGGLATELERRGADLRHPLWSARLLIENPTLIRQVHEDYYRAGADVGISASYQASLAGFKRQGLSHEEAAHVMRLSVQLVKDARDQFYQSGPTDRVRPLVAASLGCYGASLHDGSEYRGDYGLSVRELMDWHRPRLVILMEETPDLFACETIPCLEEAEALVRLFEEYRTIPAWLSFSCRDERHLSQGQPFADATALVADLETIVAVGINCTAPRFVVPLLQSLPANLKTPRVVYPNSGEKWDAVAQTWRGTDTPEDWGTFACAWRDAGATLIGGCCRTTPATIRAMRASLLGERESSEIAGDET